MHPSYAAGTNTKDYIKQKLKLTFAKDIWWTGLNLIGESQADLIPVVSLSHPWEASLRLPIAKNLSWKRKKHLIIYKKRNIS